MDEATTPLTETPVEETAEIVTDTAETPIETPVEEATPEEIVEETPVIEAAVEETPVEAAPEPVVNIPYQQPDLPGTPCPQCKGEGLVGEQRCTNCTGTGRII